MKQKPIGSIWTDEQWQAIAIRDTNVLVSAGAGSGKTAVLSERVLELVRSGVDVTKLIVLTFTNAAAAEMKQRIRNKLLDAATESEFIAQNAQKIDNSYITTFDSYCLFLVKKYNYLLNVSQDISIIDSVTAAIQKQAIINHLLIEQVEMNNRALIEFIETYSATGMTEIVNILLNWYNQQIQNMEPFTITDEKDLYLMYEQLVLEKVDQITQLVEEINRLAGDTNLPDKINERLANLLAIKSYEHIHLNIEEVFETRFWQVPRGEFPDKEYVKKLNDRLKSSLKQLRTYAKLSTAMHLQLVANNNQIKVTINNLMLDFEKRYQQYKQKQGLYEFIDINLLAIDLLQANPQVCAKLKTDTYEIMIDEYQDTNDIQERFVNLIASNNVYMVGDIKQSIYGFRNANPSLFSEKFQAYSHSQGGKLITLTQNFRSRSSVLSQVNDLFGQVMSREYGGISYDQSQIMLYGNKSFDLLADTNHNQVITYDSNDIPIDKSDFEIIQIFKDIKAKLESGYQVVDGDMARNVCLSDFAIIAATRSNFERIVTIGQYFNISVNADIQEQFSTSPEIAVIQSIFNILNIIKCGFDAEQKYIFSVMQLARSYLFDYTDLQIDQAITSLNRIDSKSISKLGYSLQMGELTELGNIINELASNLDLKSNSMILSQAIDKLQVVNRLHRVANPLVAQLRITKISQLIEDFDQRNYQLFEVCQILNEIERNSELDIEFSSKSELETESVTVITTHKSKGLEYEICYFPFLFKKFNAMDINSRYGYSKQSQYIFPSKLETGNLTATFEKTLLTEARMRELISEKIRLLYVALTRAKDKNILLVDINKLENDKFKTIESAQTLNDFLFNSWDYIKQDKCDSFELTEAEIAASIYNRFGTMNDQRQKPVEHLVYQPLNLDVTTYEKRRASGHIQEVISKTVATNIQLGNDVHEQLEFADLTDLTNLIEQASGPFKQALMSIDQSNLLNGMINYYPEFQFKQITDSEINGIIDLLVETENSFIIIDYKLNDISKDEYVAQVTTYVEYIKSITTKNVEGYLLSLLSGGVKKVC